MHFVWMLVGWRMPIAAHESINHWLRPSSYRRRRFSASESATIPYQEARLRFCRHDKRDNDERRNPPDPKKPVTRNCSRNFYLQGILFAGFKTEKKIRAARSSSLKIPRGAITHATVYLWLPLPNERAA
jgi:hypothetical protein